MTSPRAAAAATVRFGEESEPIPPATVRLVEGASFAICDAAGDIVPGGVEGLFVADTRVCSQLTLTVDGVVPSPLAVTQPSPFEALFVARSPDRSILVRRELHVGRGMRVDVSVRNLLPSHRTVEVAVTVGADLAHLFAVKEGRANHSPSTLAKVEDDALVFGDEAHRRGLVVRTQPTGDVAEEGVITWQVELAPHEDWRACLELAAVRGGEEVEPQYRCGEPTQTAAPSQQQAHWQRTVPRIQSDIPGLAAAFDRAADDLGGLRLFDPDHADEPLIAAGAPWYMTLFGRDSLITSWMALLVDPELALATVRVLARLQGRDDVAETEEQPGRILHEVRFSSGSSLALKDGSVYYGSVDATPLFVMLVHELWKWGTPLDVLAPVLPAVDAALDWMAGPGDPDGDGYIEYAARHESSLVNQGWKDSFDSISFANGELAQAPITLCEVQAYAYAAWLGGADLAEARGDNVTATTRRGRAEALQQQFEQDFWLPDQEIVALALDHEDRPVDAVASNMGHCLWTGIVRDPEMTKAIARHLTGPELFTGWGIRTLATTMARYNPLSYHNGSVWPHDTAIALAGLRRAGHVDETLQLATALLAAASVFGGTLPELFAGLTRDEFAAPVPYPSSCSPQAWSAASPLLVVRALLGLEPDLPNGTVAMDPVLPAGSTSLHLADVPLGQGRVSVEVDGDALAVRGLPRGVSLLWAPG